jgi:hypothetical protein
MRIASFVFVYVGIAQGKGWDCMDSGDLSVQASSTVGDGVTIAF